MAVHGSARSPVIYLLHPSSQPLRVTLRLEVLNAMSSTAMLAGRVGPARKAAAIWGPWLAGWVGASVIGVANGVARRALYEDRIGPGAAHYLSTGTLLVLLGGYMAFLAMRWP